MSKKLVIYYTRSGNTKAIAETIAKEKQAEIIELSLVDVYPADYNELLDYVRAEQRKNVLPQLVKIKDISEYDTIYLGSPIWFGSIAAPIVSLLSTYDFSNKTIIPFCTHGGGGKERAFTDIKRYCKKATVLSGYECYGKGNGKQILHWLATI